MKLEKLSMDKFSESRVENPSPIGGGRKSKTREVRATHLQRPDGTILYDWEISKDRDPEL